MGTPNLSNFLNTAKSFAGLVSAGNNIINNSDKGREILDLFKQATGRDYSGPWCAVFVSACAQKAGLANKIIAPASFVGDVYNKTATNFRGTKHAGPGQGANYIPMPGDLIIYGSDFHHIGIVNYVDGSGVHSIEGNTSVPGQAHYGVNINKSHKVTDTDIYAYVTPDWGSLGDDLSSLIRERGQMQNTYSLGSVRNTVMPTVSTSTSTTSTTPTSSSTSATPDSINFSNIESYIQNMPDNSLACSPQYLYATKNDRHDMTLRQVGYLSSSYELSNTRSAIAISVINYTSKLGDLYNTFSTMSIGNKNVSTSNLSGLEKLVVDFLLEQGYNGATACALAGCIKNDSNYSTSASSTRQNTLCKGICQWQGDRLQKLISQTGPSWASDLSGQLNYLMYELSTVVPKLNAYILYQPLDISSISLIVDAYTRNMCYPISNKSDEIEEWVKRRILAAEEIYNKLVITAPTIVGTSTQISDINNNPLSPQEVVEIPPYVQQTGIEKDYTSYSYWYTRWHYAASPQKKLANMWYEQGCPSDRGIATIGGYYCIAVRPKYGSCGDIVLVTLQNGDSFLGIICDEKGEDAGSEWGHKKFDSRGNFRGISLIEWEAVKSRNNKVVTLLDDTSLTSGDVDMRDDSTLLGTWLGQLVTSITNYGKYVNVTWG